MRAHRGLCPLCGKEVPLRRVSDADAPAGVTLVCRNHKPSSERFGDLSRSCEGSGQPPWTKPEEESQR